MLLIQLLDDLYRLYYYNNIAHANSLYIDKVEYILDEDSKKNEGFIGFFDWLRTDESTIVGIRISFFEHHNYNHFLINLPYVTPAFDNRCMEILFQEGGYDLNLSGDQDFTNNYVYRSDSGEYLFTFGLDHLTNNELNSLLKFCKTINETELLEGK